MRARRIAVAVCLAVAALPAHAEPAPPSEPHAPKAAPVDAASPVPAPMAAQAPQAVAPLTALTLAIKTRLVDRRLDAASKDRQSASQFYEARNGAPLFADANGLTHSGRAVLDELSRADDWGLPAAELVPAKLDAARPLGTDGDLADAEVRIALAAIKYAHFARGARIPEPSRQLATYLDRSPQLPDAREVLDKLAAATDAAAALRAFNPQQPAFEALRQAYVEARKRNAGSAEAPDFPNDTSIRPGMRSSQVVALRRVLKVAMPASADGQSADPTVYDPALVAAVTAFQDANGLTPADGIVGNRTRAALNSLAPPSARKLLANMEQWRWMPADLGATNITVNIPEFTLRMTENNAVIHAERIVAGLVTNQTPIFSDMMQTVVLQPDWVLPMSIKVNEALPSLLRGGGMFYSNGLRVKRGETDVDPHSVSWTANNIKNYTFYQPPGDSNALGQVKFLFPNKHAVYMHDTPAKQLFNSSERAFSHGCMRVRNPVKLAQLILAHDKGWDAAKVQDLIEEGPEDNKIALDTKIPVHVTYFTAVPQGDGTIKTFRDVYGHEQRISLALEGRWSEIDIPPDHLAPVEDREFEYRAASYEQRAQREDAAQSSKGKSDFENALKALFGGF